jgi:hypothetical protein
MPAERLQAIVPFQTVKKAVPRKRVIGIAERVPLGFVDLI